MWFSARAVSSERELQASSRLDRRRDAFRGVPDAVEVAGGIVVLNRAPDRPCRRYAGDGKGSALRRSPVAVLQVNRHRKLSGPVERGRVIGHFVQRDMAVEAPEGEGEASAAGGQRLEPQGSKHPR
jgi:hypothetical protein